MEKEFDERLRASHESVQYQLLSKLSVSVERFAVKNGVIEDGPQPCSELQQLFYYLGDANTNISWYASRLLHHLVKKGSVCGEYLISSCISLSALGKPLKSSIHLILLTLPLQNVEENSLVDKHPLSRVLTNQPKSVDVIFSSIHHHLITCMESDIVGGSNTLECAVVLLKPFINFVLVDCTHAVDLFGTLLDAASVIFPVFSDEVRGLFHQLLDSLSNKYILKKNGLKMIAVIQRVGVWYLDHEKSFVDSPVHMNVVSLLMTVCWNAIEAGDNHRVFTALHLVKKLLVLNATTGKHAESGRNENEAILFVCALLLLKIDNSLTLQLLQIVMLVLPSHLEALTVCEAKPLISMLFLPILQILSQRKSSPQLEEDTLTIAIAENLFTNIEKYLKANQKETGTNNEQQQQKPVFQHINDYSEILNVASASVYLLNRFFTNKEVALSWCSDIIKLYELKPPVHLKENIVLQLSALLVCNYDEDVFREALRAMVLICKHCCNLVNVFLPILLYMLRSKSHQTVKLNILYTFPQIASSKTVISSILKVILSLSGNLQLLPVCVMLMTTLWLEQPRVYPYLLQLLNKEVGSTSSELWFELHLARVTTILQICKRMPTTHGEDMVVLISNIMEEAIIKSYDDNLWDKCASCLALLLEGLKALCLSRVIDIRSIWKAVVSKVKVKNHRVILQSLCSLLSAFPSIAGEGKEEFLEEVLVYLWSLVQHEDQFVVGSAYKALSLFPAHMMKVMYLPEKIAVEVAAELKALKQHKDDEEYNPMEEVCPGFAIMVLLHETPKDAMEGFQLFLQSILQQEVESLPRGIGCRTFVKSVSSTYNQIPTILQTQYESSNRPAVLPGVAAGILCCFEPKIQGMNVENPSNLHLKLMMGRYKMMLDNLLQEFTIKQNDWHQVLLAPRSWTHFMKKLYDAVIRGRTADLILKNDKEPFEDEEEFKEDLESVKFWARDDITNQLRKASKGTPKLQGNSMFALVGLLNAVTTYEEDDESDYPVPDRYVSMRSWIVKVTDTVITIFDGNFKAKGKPFQWCQQVSSEKSTASSNFSRCCAAVCLSELVQPLLSIDTNRIMQMTHILKKASLGSANAGSVTQFHFYCLIGWGLLLSRLSQEQFAELAGCEGRTAMLTSLSMMEEIVFKDEANVQVGAVIGYGLAISSLFTHSTQKDSKVHALLSYEKLLQKCTPYTPEDTAIPNKQGFCFALACTTMNAYLAGNVSADDVQSCAELIGEKIKGNPEACDLYISLGVLCYALLISSSSQVSSFATQVLEEWLALLNDKDSPVQTKIGCIKGFTTACGIDLLVFKLRDPDKFVELPQIKSVILLLQKMLISSKDINVCYLAAQSLGQLHLISLVRNQGENSNIPQNYNYLKEMSVLRSIFNSLVSAVTLGPYSDWNDAIVCTLVASLNNLNDCRLPPVNWTAVLSPLIRMGYNVDVKQTCMLFAIKFIQQSSSLTRSITAWLQLATFINMEEVLQRDFFENAPAYLSCLSNSEQRGLVEILPMAYLSNKNEKGELRAEHLKHVVTLWISILEMTCIVQSSVAYIMSGLSKLIALMSTIPFDIVNQCLSGFAKCIYLLMKDNWPGIINDISTSNLKLSSLLQIEVLKNVENLTLEHILNVVLLGYQEADVAVHSHLFKTLFELCCDTNHHNIIKEATKKLITQELFVKSSRGASDIILLVLMLSSPLEWTVFPYTSSALKQCAGPAFSTMREVVLFKLPNWLSAEQVLKVQHALVEPHVADVEQVD